MDTQPRNEEGRRRDLRRFGYRKLDGNTDDISAVWKILRCDFLNPWDQSEFSDLPEAARAAVKAYCGQRSKLDALLDRCDEIHLEFVKKGHDASRVEAYALARDAFEDAVELFGELRIAAQYALTNNPAN